MTEELWVSPEAARKLVEAKQTDEFIKDAARGRSAELRDKDEAARRKAIPVYTGFVKYFPDAILAVAALSRIGNDQHNEGEPLHWSKEKSSDHPDCLLRHMIDDARGEAVDSDGVLHKTKVAWRAMADLQIALENAPSDDDDESVEDLDLNENSKPKKIARPAYQLATSPRNAPADWFSQRADEEVNAYVERLNTGWKGDLT